MNNPATVPLGLDDLTDEGLARVEREYRRMVEDGRPDAKQAALWAKRAHGLRMSRLRLKMRYRAVDNHAGTDSYDRYYRLNEQPTYKLAAAMDHWNAQNGRRHVLAWPIGKERGE